MSDKNNKSVTASFFQLNIKNRLLLGFSVICMVLIVSVGTTIVRLNHINEDITHIDKLRVPTATASSSLVKDIHGSLAALRGYLLTNDATFKSQRQAVLIDIDHLVGEMDHLSEGWTNSNNRKNWATFKNTLNEFKDAQVKVEGMAHTTAQFPANLILKDELMPRAAIMFNTITQLIDLEANLPATNARKKLLGTMADVRGTLGLSLANIRAFLLTGESEYQVKFEDLWKTNNQRFQDLSKMVHILSPKQKSTFAIFVKARNEVISLPAKIFTIRKSEKWNMANYLLVTEAAPAARKMLEILNGADGQGGMVASQRLLLENDVEDALEQSDDLVMSSWALLAIGIFISGVVGVFSARSITVPLSAITDVMKKLAAGDITVNIPGLDRKDEIATMAYAVEGFKQNAVDRVRLEQENSDAAEAQLKHENEEREAEEDRKKIEVDREKKAALEQEQRTERVNGLIERFDHKVTDVLKLMKSSSIEMSATAKQMVATSSDTKSRSSVVAAASEESAANVNMVAAAAEELSSSVSEINRQLIQANKISLKAVKEAKESETAIEALAQSANNINNVIGMISDIAEQTNLLALNATIESARAGEAGKGFAVVANEVKALASQTGTATDQISQQISEMQTLTAKAVNSIKTIVEVNNISNETTENIQAAIEQQSLATVEISENIQQVVAGTSEVSSNITQVAQGADETGAAGDQVLSVAGELDVVAETLKTDIESFLSEVRTA